MAATRPAFNPFSTRAVRPGAIRFRFPSTFGPDDLLRRLADHRWWGEIIGPHGSGKTTLLETLIPHLEQAGRQLVQFELHAGRSSLQPKRRGPASAAEQEGESQDTQPAALRWNARTLVIVDGYEQLGWIGRWLLKMRCRRWRSGLLVTTHQPTGLPQLFQTSVTRELTRELVQSLLPHGCRILDAADIDRCFDRHRFDPHSGNLRETLFALYDVYEERIASGELGAGGELGADS